MRQRGGTSMSTNLVGRAASPQPATSRLFGVENKSRPVGGCGPMARPTLSKLEFSHRLVSLGTSLFHDRLIHQAPRQRVYRPRRSQILVLHHPHEGEVAH